jgi:hypothetical protein
VDNPLHEYASRVGQPRQLAKDYLNDAHLFISFLHRDRFLRVNGFDDLKWLVEARFLHADLITIFAALLWDREILFRQLARRPAKFFLIIQIRHPRDQMYY